MNSPVEDILLKPIGKYGPFGESRMLMMLGATAMVGNSAARLYFTVARASRKRASAAFRSWLETATCSSSAFSGASPKISHQAPRGKSARGFAVFHCPASLNESGGGSLYAGGAAAEGRLYLGPTMQPASRTTPISEIHGRGDLMAQRSRAAS